MKITLRERLSRVWQPVSHFLLMLDSGGAAGGFEDLHQRLEVMSQRLNRLEAGGADIAESPGRMLDFDDRPTIHSAKRTGARP
jgi:hypothetical protein